MHITHGMAEHAGRYAWFMQILKEAGYAVYAHDIRGHGYTYACNSSKGHFCDKNGLDKILHDLDFSIDLIKKNHPNIPIYCFGHSLGSILLLRYATSSYHRINGIACWNSGIETNLLAIVGRIILSIERKLRSPRSKSYFAWNLTFQTWAGKIKNRRTNFDWLSNDKDHVDNYHEQLDSLLSVSDVLSVCCPASKETVNLINKDALEKLPKGAVVTNVARGDIVDDDALIDALDRRKVYAVGLDVYNCLLYTSPSPRDRTRSRMPSSA